MNVAFVEQEEYIDILENPGFFVGYIASSLFQMDLKAPEGIRVSTGSVQNVMKPKMPWNIADKAS